MTERISDTALSYNESVEQAGNSQLLLNILRARDRRPMYFTAISQLRGAFTLSSAGNISIEIPFGGDADNIFPLTPSITVTETQSPSFDVAVLNSQEFISGILTPVRVPTFGFFWDQGWPEDMLLYLMIHRVTEGDDIYRNSPAFADRIKADIPSTFEKFQEWVLEANPKPSSAAANDGKSLRVGTEKTADVVGPAVDFAAAENLEALVKVAESKENLILVPDAPGSAKQRLCKISKEPAFCLGPCPDFDAVKECQKSDLSAAFKGDSGRPGEAVTVQERAPENDAADQAPPTKVYMRTIQGIVYYLGEILRYQAEKKDVFVRCGPGYKPVRLFALTQDPDEAASPMLSVTYNGQDYYVPKPVPGAACGGHLTLNVLALLDQLMGLHRKSEELPTTRAVVTVGP